jgi:hypothetical protein
MTYLVLIKNLGSNWSPVSDDNGPIYVIGVSVFIRLSNSGSRNGPGPGERGMHLEIPRKYSCLVQRCSFADARHV